ncbi:hypothetical protein [Aeromonas sp. Marseille-Q5825]|uniref:hypothetical protein n=1 Tax=Aeromonas sp. Marseille-Q5825 TaxID=2972767 RepID=UPI0021CAD660|nr:hypothetical protein [Aeromonas sp. Marseille-Q5825]
MSFVINSDEWTFDNIDQALHQSIIDSFLDRIGTAIDRKEKIWIGENLQKKIVYEDKDFWTFMASMPSEISQECSAWLDRAPLYIDETNFPDELIENSLLAINDAQENDNLDLSWAHYNNLHGVAVGCIGLHESGVFKTSSNLGEVDIHIIGDEKEHLNFWRNAIDIEGNTSDKFRQLSENAFPDLHFHNNVLDGIDDLVGGYFPLRSAIMKYMSILNDHGEWIFTTPPPILRPDEIVINNNLAPTNQIIRDRFTGFGITVEPENPNVSRNADSRRARTITMEGSILYCEWHGKLQVHQNRIYIHKPVPESKNKMIIAFICEHLPLP